MYLAWRAPTAPTEGRRVSDYSPTDLAAQLKSGLLSFPVTHFTADLEFDEGATASTSRGSPSTRSPGCSPRAARVSSSR